MYSTRARQYPISGTARKEVGKLDIDDLATDAVVALAKAWVSDLINRKEHKMAGTDDDPLAFFATSYVVSKFDDLSYRFATTEANRMRDLFRGKDREYRTEIFADCFGETFEHAGKDRNRQDLLAMPVERYLALIGEYGLASNNTLKLVNQDMRSGTVYIQYDHLPEIFYEAAKHQLMAGLRRFKGAQTPKVLQELTDSTAASLPEEKDRKARDAHKYNYIEELLAKPVKDGRHRLLWMVLTPYLITVKGLTTDDAIARLVDYSKKSGDKRDLRAVVLENVRRVSHNHLLPPTLYTLKKRHPDIYEVLPAEIKRKHGMHK
ncbi:MAG: DNA primase noncatalytic subunit PriX [Nitrososphaerota archaeon]|nr:DNA primase noncatalytic subunit PriX [Nitrososphaerota archaeon]